MSLLKKLRPGSGATGAVSRTEGADHQKKPQGGPLPGTISAPGAAHEPFSNDGISYPVALSTTADHEGMIASPDPTEEAGPTLLRDGTQLNPFAYHEPDDEGVLEKLFGLRF